MPKWLIITLIIVAGLVGNIGLFGGGAYFLYSFVWSMTAGLVEPVDRQLAALKDGNMQAAYAETSQAFQRQTPLPAFTIFVDQHPILKDAADHSFTTYTINNDDGYLAGSLTSSAGGVTPIEYRLVWENETWKIVDIDVESAGSS